MDHGTCLLCTAYFEILNPNPSYTQTDLCVHLTMSKNKEFTMWYI
jgi:hypothetical protein